MDFHSGHVRLAYTDHPPVAAGDPTPVLLVHGFASSARVNWVDTGWIKVLTDAGRRVIAFDHRGHGASDKPHAPADYATTLMAQDALALLDHLDIARADVMGYSMGARVTAFLALVAPARVRSAILGGLGIHLVEGQGLPTSIAEAMEAPSADVLSDPAQRMFRRFAEAGGNDLEALAACIRGSRQILSAQDAGRIGCPVLVAVGTKDAIAGDPHRLAALIPHAIALDIPGRDHNPAVGDKAFKAGVLDFLNGLS